MWQGKLVTHMGTIEPCPTFIGFGFPHTPQSVGSRRRLFPLLSSSDQVLGATGFVGFNIIQGCLSVGFCWNVRKKTDSLGLGRRYRVMGRRDEICYGLV